MFKFYLSLFNTICCLTFDQILFIFSDYFQGDFEVDFSNLKGTELGIKIEEARKERAKVKYKKFVLLAAAIQRAIEDQLPKKFVQDLHMVKIIPSDVTNLILNERRRGNYVSRQSAYQQLLEFMNNEMIKEWRKREVKSNKYLQAVQWRQHGVEVIAAEIQRREIEQKEKERIESLKRREEAEKKKREEWLLLREQRILEEMNELDEEITTMEKEKFKQEEEMNQLRSILGKIENISLKYSLLEQVHEYENQQPVWFFEMAEDEEACYIQVMTRTLSIDFKISDPYHIYLIHQILKEGAKAFRSSLLKDREMHVIMYLVELDPSPNIQICARFRDDDRLKAFDFNLIKEQLEQEF